MILQKWTSLTAIFSISGIISSSITTTSTAFSTANTIISDISTPTNPITDDSTTNNILNNIPLSKKDTNNWENNPKLTSISKDTATSAANLKQSNSSNNIKTQSCQSETLKVLDNIDLIINKKMNNITALVNLIDNKKAKELTFPQLNAFKTKLQDIRTRINGNSEPKNIGKELSSISSIVNKLNNNKTELALKNIQKDINSYYNKNKHIKESINKENWTPTMTSVIFIGGSISINMLVTLITWGISKVINSYGFATLTFGRLFPIIAFPFFVTTMLLTSWYTWPKD